MSVIPLIIEGENRTVVESRHEFEDAGGLGGEVVFIQPLAREQLLIEDDANVSYDLRVGGMYRDHRNAGGTALEQSEKITLLPGAAVIVETEETVQLPSKMFGQIVPKVTLLHEGISNTTSKVDPGYNGNLLVTIFNLGKNVELQNI